MNKILLVAAFLIASIMALTMPLCPIDEVAHFSAASFLANHGRLATLFDKNDPEILALYQGTYPGKPNRSIEEHGPTNIFACQYEAVHPPFSYIISAAIALVVSADEAVRLLALRFFSVLCLVLALWITAKALESLTDNRRIAGLVLAFFFFNPATIGLCSYVNNAPFALLLSSVLAFILVQSPLPKDWSAVRCFAVGILLTLLQLTHWYTSGIILAVLSWLFLTAQPRKFLIVTAVLFVCGFAFVAYNYSLYGSITGMKLHMAIVAPAIANAPRLNNSFIQNFFNLAATSILPQFFGYTPWWVTGLTKALGTILILSMSAIFVRFAFLVKVEGF